MQFDLLRAFPYPVLRPKVNDYVDGDIQATVHLEQSSDGLTLKAEILFVISVPEILSRIAVGEAQYAVVFECRDTYYRQPVTSSNPTFDHPFPPGSLRGELLIRPYVVVTKSIEDFTCSWINEEFGPGPFAYKEGSVLALDEPKMFYVDREAFKPISSAFILVANENVSNHDWRIDASGDKVKIQVGHELKERIDTARNSKRNKAVLLNSIYFGAVMQCLSHLRSGSEYDGYRWANIFKRKLDELNLVLKEHDEATLAQALMKQPFALVETYCFEGADQ